MKGEFVAQREHFALQLHELRAVGVFDLEFGRDLDEVAVGFAQLVAFQVLEVVVFVHGEDFLLHDEIVGFKKAHTITDSKWVVYAKKPSQPCKGDLQTFSVMLKGNT